MILAQLPDDDEPAPLEQALVTTLRAWGVGRLRAEAGDDEFAEPTSAQISAAIDRALVSIRLEAGVLDRTMQRKTKFRLLDQATLTSAVDAVRGA